MKKILKIYIGEEIQQSETIRELGQWLLTKGFLEIKNGKVVALKGFFLLVEAIES